MKRHETVDQFMAAATQWREELAELRSILLATALDETVKWGSPVYTYAGKNVVGIGGFKSYFGLWFYQGALLADSSGVLINAQEGKTKALRQMRLQSRSAIEPELIDAYVREAIELLERGIEIRPDRGKPLVVPAELRLALGESRRAKKRFDEISLGKQREFAEYVSSAKRGDTKQKRIVKILPLIEAAVGLNDKYR